jgi:hypothetical protein
MTDGSLIEPPQCGQREHRGMASSGARFMLIAFIT